MSRSALFVACLLGALVIALCQGYGDQEAVTPTAQTNVAVKSEPDSGALSHATSPHVEADTGGQNIPDVASIPSAPTRAEATDEQKSEASLLATYSQSSQVKAFSKRRSSDRTAVPTVEERVEMIKELKEKIDQTFAVGHYRHSQWIAADLRSTKIDVAELGEDYVQKLANLAEHDIRRHAKNAEAMLAKGCAEDALQTLAMPIGIHRAALGERVSSEYLDSLMDRILSNIPPDDDSDARWIGYEDRRRYLGCG